MWMTWPPPWHLLSRTTSISSLWMPSCGDRTGESMYCATSGSTIRTSRSSCFPSSTGPPCASATWKPAHWPTSTRVPSFNKREIASRSSRTPRPQTPPSPRPEPGQSIPGRRQQARSWRPRPSGCAHQLPLWTIAWGAVRDGFPCRSARALPVALQRIDVEDLDPALLYLDQARLHQGCKRAADGFVRYAKVASDVTACHLQVQGRGGLATGRHALRHVHQKSCEPDLRRDGG